MLEQRTYDPIGYIPWNFMIKLAFGDEYGCWRPNVIVPVFQHAFMQIPFSCQMSIVLISAVFVSNQAFLLYWLSRGSVKSCFISLFIFHVFMFSAILRLLLRIALHASSVSNVIVNLLLSHSQFLVCLMLLAKRCSSTILLLFFFFFSPPHRPLALQGESEVGRIPLPRFNWPTIHATCHDYWSFLVNRDRATFFPATMTRTSYEFGRWMSHRLTPGNAYLEARQIESATWFKRNFHEPLVLHFCEKFYLLSYNLMYVQCKLFQYGLIGNV